MRGSGGPRSNRRNYYDKEVHVTTTVEPPAPASAAEQFAARQQSMREATLDEMEAEWEKVKSGL